MGVSEEFSYNQRKVNQNPVLYPYCLQLSVKFSERLLKSSKKKGY